MEILRPLSRCSLLVVDLEISHQAVVYLLLVRLRLVVCAVLVRRRGLVGVVPRLLEERLQVRVVLVAMCAYPAHLIQNTAVSVLLVVPGDLAVPEHLGLGAVRAPKVRPLVVDEHYILDPHVQEPLEPPGGDAGLGKLREPGAGVRHEVVDRVGLVAIDLVEGRLEELPLAPRPVGAGVVVGQRLVTLDLGVRRPRHDPDRLEGLVQMCHFQQRQHGVHAGLVPGQHRERPTPRQLPEHGPELLHAAPGDEGGLEVVPDEIRVAPVLLVGLALGEEGGQCERFVEVEKDEFHGQLLVAALVLPLQTAHVECRLVHPGVVQKSLQVLVVLVAVRADPPHVAEEAAIPVVRVVPRHLDVAQEAHARVALEVRPHVVDQHDALGLHLFEVPVPLRAPVGEMGEPRRRLVGDVVQYVGLVVVHLLEGRVEELPLPGLLVHPVATPVAPRHGPDRVEVVPEVGRVQEVEHGLHSA
mmetsp:Transcript_23240/g.64986  ORF Transcript_23240/g.64986 Transcript_23240/m.64986 type:complete len:470 (+) Transcript_23240:244-1653(+)